MRCFALCLLAFRLFASDIAVVTLADGENYKAVVAPSIENNRKYCEKWGYDFYYFDYTFDPSRHPAWSKILAVEKVMQENPQHQWIMWVDADTLILNFSTPLEFFIDEKYNFIFAGDTDNPDFWKTNINSGIFFLRNCPWSFDLLKSVYDHIELANSHYWEQDAMHHELNFNEAKWMPKCKVVAHRLFNSWHPNYKEDFLIHFAASSIDSLKYHFETWKDKTFYSEPSLDHYFDCYGYPYVARGEENKIDTQKIASSAKKILCIGLNDGHNAEALFKAFSNLEQLVCFDADMYSYTAVPATTHRKDMAGAPFLNLAVDFLSQRYKNRFQFIKGDLLTTVPSYLNNGDFDLIVIDKNGTYDVILDTILNCNHFAGSHTQLLVRAQRMTSAAIRHCVDFGILKIENSSLQDTWIEAKYVYNMH